MITPPFTADSDQRWLTLEALLLGARSLNELEETLTLFSEALTDDVMAEWAADGRYNWLEQQKQHLPQQWEPEPYSHGLGEAESALQWRLIYCQSFEEGRRIKADATAQGFDFTQLWLRLNYSQRQRIKNLAMPIAA